MPRARCLRATRQAVAAALLVRVRAGLSGAGWARLGRGWAKGPPTGVPRPVPVEREYPSKTDAPPRRDPAAEER